MIKLLDEHAAWRAVVAETETDTETRKGEEAREDAGPDVSFSLGLTEKQRRDRAGVVLPYFDAQREEGTGAGEGGRILYDMGWEDDFDEEEDEI